jgi:prolyl-tRNA synthetase
VVIGLKSETEKFPGAEKTYTYEALMPDGKAVQMGTSHLLSQSFAKAFDMKYQNQDEHIMYPYLTSWGTTTRLVGATVMVHGDQKGLVLPPRVAPIQVIIIPILKTGADNSAVLAKVESLQSSLKKGTLRAEVDTDLTKTPGAKFYWWELRGVPIRIEIGPRDLEKGGVIVVDRLGLTKEFVTFDQLENHLKKLLDSLHSELYNRALKKRNDQWYKVAKLKEFGKQLEDKGGFYQAGWCGNKACEEQLKEYKATTRCVLETKTVPSCFWCDQPSKHDVLIARAY